MARASLLDADTEATRPCACQPLEEARALAVVAASGCAVRQLQNSNPNAVAAISLAVLRFR
jgi:hypothetical protein